MKQKEPIRLPDQLPQDAVRCFMAAGETKSVQNRDTCAIVQSGHVGGRQDSVGHQDSVGGHRASTPV